MKLSYWAQFSLQLELYLKKKNTTTPKHLIVYSLYNSKLKRLKKNVSLKHQYF